MFFSLNVVYQIDSFVFRKEYFTKVAGGGGGKLACFSLGRNKTEPAGIKKLAINDAIDNQFSSLYITSFPLTDSVYSNVP